MSLSEPRLGKLPVVDMCKLVLTLFSLQTNVCYLAIDGKKAYTVRMHFFLAKLLIKGLWPKYIGK